MILLYKGLILGTNIQRWNNAGFKLSELLDMYYSEVGISGEPQFRSCSRGTLFNGAIDRGVILEQSKSFASLYNNYTQSIPSSTIISDPNVFLSPVNDVYNRMWGVAGKYCTTVLIVCFFRNVVHPCNSRLLKVLLKEVTPLAKEGKAQLLPALIRMTL